MENDYSQGDEFDREHVSHPVNGMLINEQTISTALI
jgi:hypothetical protein